MKATIKDLMLQLKQEEERLLQEHRIIEQDLTGSYSTSYVVGHESATTNAIQSIENIRCLVEAMS